MTTIYRKKGAVHGFSIEFYRVIDGLVEYCNQGGNWVPSSISIHELSEHTREQYFERVEWVRYRDEMLGNLYRVAGPFVEVCEDGMHWMQSIISREELSKMLADGLMFPAE